MAATAVGLRDEELHMEDVAVRILPQPAEPHGAAATFDLAHTRSSEEAARESWSVSMARDEQGNPIRDEEGQPKLEWVQRDRPLVKLHYVFNVEQTEVLELRPLQSPCRGRSGRATSAPRR